jgi:hypothetical protein
MNTKRPVILIIAAVCLVVLVLFSSGLAVARNFGFLGGGFGSGRVAGGRLAGGSFPQGGFTNQQPGSLPGTDNGQLPGNFNNPGGQNFPARSGFNGLFRILRGVTLAFNIAALVLGVLAVIGIWQRKKWGAILGIILAALLLLTSLTGLFRFFSWLSFAEALLKVLLGLAVIVLLLLPAARWVYAPPPEPEF